MDRPEGLAKDYEARLADALGYNLNAGLEKF